MKHYKDSNGKVRGIYDGHEHLIKSDWVEMTAEEVKLHENPPKSAEEIIAEKVVHFTTVVDGMIDAEIEAYNKANYVVFTGINSLEKYNHPEAEHYAFANSMITWVTTKDTGLWATARRIQQEVLSGTIPEPTDAQFIAMLPTRT